MNVPYGTPLTAPHVTTGGYADGKQLTREGRHVGLDFYDLLIEGRLQCAVKGTGPQREKDPPGNWIAPPGSNGSGGGGNKAAGASGVEGRIRRLGESAGCN